MAARFPVVERIGLCPPDCTSWCTRSARVSLGVFTASPLTAFRYPVCVRQNHAQRRRKSRRSRDLIAAAPTSRKPANARAVFGKTANAGELAGEVETAVHGERQEDGQYDRDEQTARRAAIDLDAATLCLLRLEHMQVVPAVDFVDASFVDVVNRGREGRVCELRPGRSRGRRLKPRLAVMVGRQACTRRRSLLSGNDVLPSCAISSPEGNEVVADLRSRERSGSLLRASRSCSSSDFS